jgi:uncharacterized protein (DUF433 family)
MADTVTAYRHVVLREDGVPVIAGTRITVLDLIEQKLAYGWSPEEIQFQHPSLSMGQIHSALSFYWDHAQEMDRELHRRAAEFDRLREHAESRSLADRLRALKARQE